MKIRARTLYSFWEKTKGLIGNNKQEPIFFQTRWGIHTFGMTQTITVAILDDSNKIVKIKELRPNRIFFWNPKYNQVLEIPQGYNLNKLKIGETVEFI